MLKRMKEYSVWLLFMVCMNFFDKFGHVTGSQVSYIRGIPVSKNTLYAPDRDFECLDGSLLIPFHYVNDDYCDCGDGSDEPGTSACQNGSFYCKNFGHKPIYIPSTWVNDNICDCCDGSDEYTSTKQCVNNCHDLGREARLEAQKAEELQKEGNKIRLEMVAKGKQIKSDTQTHFMKLWVDYEEATKIKKEKEILKTQAEERESVALMKYKVDKPEQVAPKETTEEEEIRQSEAEDYFKILDSDGSNTVTIAELQTRATFDKDRDGAVSQEEAMFFLNNQKEVSLQEFIETAWGNIKPFVMLEQGIFKHPERKIEEKEEEEEEEETREKLEEGHAKEEHDNIEEEEDIVDEHEKEVEEQEPDEQEPEVQYDEETQVLIDEATSARERYQEAEKAVNDLNSEIKRLEEKLERDYGKEDEFVTLDGECFDYSDLEYTYSLCLFGKASQRSKSGGSDVSLGYWSEWIGGQGNKYSKIRYDKGLTCWNGPARTTIVNLSCGKENKLISVTEPSRCEYAMEFVTPALCNPSTEKQDTHDEL
ncbi:PREDICTED: glucosidase 2 subunit beta [Polistes canadensis]|uniref:glucosidase 2 subunit beta n=1 Tax=Polistes canadensis TaxID=91411 RepID=UPI0007190555|nr:PREDICTED: glucosidase 2 subunit beta [Polistes canadensis]